jgi:PKD repeat protein
LTADFTDLSADPDGAIVAWAWDFGDGAASSSQNPSHIFPGSGTFDVLLTVTDDGGASDTLGQQVTVSDGSGASQMYVADMSGASAADGSGWKAMVTIWVVDENGDPVPNAVVSGAWSKGFYASSSCTTGANGQCMVEQTGVSNKTRWVAFTADSVVHPTLTYNAALNSVSFIRVDQP